MANKNFNVFFSITGATTTDLPPGVLYRVKATYRYIKEDADELSFEVGEIVNVIEYDDPEDQVNIKFTTKIFQLNQKLIVSFFFSSNFS